MSFVDNQPLRYWRGQPVYFTHYATLALTVGIIAMLLIGAAQGPVEWFAFHPSSFLHGLLWQPFTYVLVNDLNFFTPLGLLCFFSWGVEVEKYLGRRFFMGLCAGLIGVPVLLSLLLTPLGAGFGLATDYYVVVGLLIAFATLYPNMDYLGGWIPLKWFAFVMVACGSITYFPSRNWLGLGTLLLCCLTAFLMVRSARGLFDFKFSLPGWARRKPKLRVMPPAEFAAVPRRAAAAAAPAPSATEAEMDALLDKIARGGMQSLTGAERERLEHARQELLRKSR